MNNKLPKVMFIGGFGRSGSTLLERMLGQTDGFFVIGELRHIWERSFSENQLCGCGKPFKSCEFWRQVVTEVFGSFDRVPLDQIIDLKRSIDRIQYVPQMVTPFKLKEYHQKFKTYSAILTEIYQTIQSLSGCDVIVDSSKDHSYGHLLASIKEIDLFTLHLVRDSRATAFSWLRKKRRPEIHWAVEYMPQYTPLRSSLIWNVMNLSIASIRYRRGQYLRIRYEDLVSDPSSTLGHVLEFLGERDKSLDFIKNKVVKLDLNHTVSGNPIRFEQGHMEIRADNEWRNKMDKKDFNLVTFLTWPLLMSYGYLSSGNQ